VTRAGEVHYVIAAGRFGGGGSGGSGRGSGRGNVDVSSQITSWVEANFSSRSVSGITL
jgi:hypothetical protein